MWRPGTRSPNSMPMGNSDPASGTHSTLCLSTARSVFRVSRSTLRCASASDSLRKPHRRRSCLRAPAVGRRRPSICRSSWIAQNHRGDPGVQALAIYPRNELLKDQIAEALSQVELIAEAGGPVIAIGALFGPTASQARWIADDADKNQRGWRRTGDVYACTYLRCPKGCNTDLVWRAADVAAAREFVECPKCGWRSRPGQLALTRETIGRKPPAVLFTTTEMLNRGLADSWMRPVSPAGGIHGRGCSSSTRCTPTTAATEPRSPCWSVAGATRSADVGHSLPSDSRQRSSRLRSSWHRSPGSGTWCK